MEREESLAVRIAYSLLKLMVLLLNTVVTFVVLEGMVLNSEYRFGGLPDTRELRRESSLHNALFIIPLCGFVMATNLLPLTFKAWMARKGLLKYVTECVPDEVIYHCEGLSGRENNSKLSAYLRKARDEYGIGKDEARVLEIWYSYFWDIQHQKQYHKGNDGEEEALQPIQWDEETSKVLDWREKEEADERERNKSPIPEEILQKAEETKKEIQNNKKIRWL